MNIGFRTGAIDIGQPVNWSAGLNYGLVSWWLAINQGPYFGSARFLDLCGRNHGTLTNGPTWGGARGRPGGWGALSFDGSDDYVVSAAHSSPSNATISLWVCPLAAWSGTILIAGFVNTAGSEYSTYISWSVNSYKANMYDGGNKTAGGTTGATAGLWQHVALTQAASGTIKIFVNGVEEGSTAIGTPYSSWSDGPFLTTQKASGFAYNNAAADDVRYWNRALSASEVSALYNASRTGYQNELNWRRRYTVFDVGGGAPATTSRARFLPTNWAA